MIVAAFDFDGTITNKDTFIAFIFYSKGKRKLIFCMLKYLHLLVAYKLGIYPNWKIKQKIFSNLFKGMPINEFNAICHGFYIKNRNIIRKDAQDVIRKHQANGDNVIIVTASVENWVAPFANMLQISTVLGTKAEVTNGALTGCFASKNCHGKEKVVRVLEAFPNRTDYSLVAYGDSRGDRELLCEADKSYYKIFRN